MFAALSFDASIFEMTLALGAGATLCQEEQQNLLPGPALVEVLRRRAITVVTLPPSSLGVLPLEDCPALRMLFVAGEACSSELIMRWAPGRLMINGYGPTETTVWATFAKCVPDGRAPSIGKGVANTILRILDRHMRPVPIGVPGELCIGGEGVARGYLGRPDLTAASFIPDPWGTPGSRMYRTGDLVRWRADGNIDFLGRLDRQIKLRGIRIETGEIEAVIGLLQGVAYCVVVLREVQPGNPALIGYVVPNSSAMLDGEAIRRQLQQQLPGYLVPTRVIIIRELPRTPTGKLDLSRLPPLPQLILDEEPSAPHDSVQRCICQICSEVFDMPVGLEHNFFEIGGHSLLLIRVLSRIREELGIDVPVRRMFESSTLAVFCKGLEAQQRGSSEKIPCLSRRTESKRGCRAK
jgi:acyl-coenzyme A synthetase/AMP-(fatty) acid ligase